MLKTVRAACPQCKTALNIPADWVGRTMKCKSCGALVRTRTKSEPAGPPPGPDILPVPALPAVPQSLPVDHEFPDADDDAPPVIARRRGRYSPGSPNGNFLLVIVCLLLVAGMVVGGISLVKHLADTNSRQEQTANNGKDNGKSEPKNGTEGGKGEVEQKAGPFPRRLLFISITKYMYLNPLTATKDGIDQSKLAAQRIAYDWRIPSDKDNNQVFLLSDTSVDASILMKNVVLGAYERFFETSRDQDRIVIYFGGHAIEKDGKAYLATVEGEIEGEGEGWRQSLIALDDFYAKLQRLQGNPESDDLGRVPLQPPARQAAAGQRPDVPRAPQGARGRPGRRRGRDLLLARRERARVQQVPARPRNPHHLWRQRLPGVRSPRRREGQGREGALPGRCSPR